MPNKVTSPVQVLEQEISQLELAIATTEREFLGQSEENAQFTEALRLLSVGVAEYIPTGRIVLMDAVRAHLDEASDIQDRQYRWDCANKALVSGQEAAVALQSELERLRYLLAIRKDEHDWVKNYEPHAEKYRSGFISPSPEQKKQERVKALEADINQRRGQLQRAQAWVSEPEGTRSYYPGNAWEEVRYLGEAIPILVGQLERLRVEPVGEYKKYEASFCEYVKARVAVQPALALFLEVQEEYLEALKNFKQAIAAHPQAAIFPAVALTEPRIVLAETNIKLAEAQLAPVKARLW